MSDTRIRYRDLCGYKYRLAAECVVETLVRPEKTAAIQGFVWLEPTGIIHIADSYAWDGPSGPTFDTPDFMRGSLVHDALYQLMREKKLTLDFRVAADKTLRKICTQDGMSTLRASYVYLAVRLFAKSATLPRKGEQDRVFEAP